MPSATTLTIILVLAVITEMLVEYFLKPILPKLQDPDNPEWWETLPYARYLAAAVGLTLTLYYQIDILALMFPDMPPSIVGMALTGLLISRGANYLHDWIANPVIAHLLNQ